jgi:hypothetical protein
MTAHTFSSHKYYGKCSHLKHIHSPLKHMHLPLKHEHMYFKVRLFQNLIPLFKKRNSKKTIFQKIRSPDHMSQLTIISLWPCLNHSHMTSNHSPTSISQSITMPECAPRYIIDVDSLCSLSHILFD